MKKFLLITCIFITPMVKAVTPPALDRLPQPQIFQNWILDRCAGKITFDKGFRDDAFKSASVWLEYSKLPVDAFNDADKLIDESLKTKLTGSVDADFKVFKCNSISQGNEQRIIFKKYNSKLRAHD
ncbi:T6SS amidase immunity protein Tai4 family protein [Erwinia sp. HDF1-3R]|uniref:T6SS amidase immunity protein Tai4 family protein n=1 Tax=Erwinia sp. HDF1-3R TaxID=3141543 RepID=UPI0031F4DF76